MNVLTINRNYHESFLADQRKDIYTGELLTVGDKIVICAKCRTAYLESSWKIKGHCFINPKQCESTRTLKEIPNENIISNLTKEKPVKKTGRKGLAFALSLLTLSFIILTFYYKELYEEESFWAYQLDQKIYNLDNDINSLKDSIRIFESSISNFENQYYSFSKQSRWGDDGGYNNNYKMFFTTYKPLTLRRVNVYPDNAGEVRINLYNALDNSLIDSDNFTIEDNSNTYLLLDFRIDEPGDYYIGYEGDVKLYRNTEGGDYPYQIKDIISITGNSYRDSNFYYYFYDWNISLNINL